MNARHRRLNHLETFLEWQRQTDTHLSVAGEPFWTDEQGRPAPNDEVKDIANGYCAQYGLPAPNHSVYVDVDQQRAGRIADGYDALPKDDSKNPGVAAAYKALAKECQQQFRWAQARGMKFSPAQGDPYDGNVFEVVADIRNNHHLEFYKGGKPNIFMSEKDDKTGWPFNWLFRAVHDYYGHSAIGADFGPVGETNAWVQHMQMFTPTAQKALTTETLGQNNWTNFGRQNYDKDGNYKNIPPSARPFADQKTAIFSGEYEWVNELPPGVR